MMQIYYISFRRWHRPRRSSRRRLIRLELAISPCTRRQARQIARQESKRLQLSENGYLFQGVN